MFVKVSDIFTINTDQLILIESNPEDSTLRFRDGASIIITPAAASWLLQLLEVSQAFDFNPNPADYQQSLTSQLAQVLRDTQPYGATVDCLSALVGVSPDAVWNALCELAVERVAIPQGGIVDQSTLPLGKLQQEQLWFHASHAPACGCEFIADDNSGLHVCDLKLGHPGAHVCAGASQSWQVIIPTALATNSATLPLWPLCPFCATAPVERNDAQTKRVACNNVACGIFGVAMSPGFWQLRNGVKPFNPLQPNQPSLLNWDCDRCGSPNTIWPNATDRTQRCGNCGFVIPNLYTMQARLESSGQA